MIQGFDLLNKGSIRRILYIMWCGEKKKQDLLLCWIYLWWRLKRKHVFLTRFFIFWRSKFQAKTLIVLLLIHSNFVLLFIRTITVHYQWRIHVWFLLCIVILVNYKPYIGSISLYSQWNWSFNSNKCYFPWM